MPVDRANYDLVIAGGGLAGATLAIAMAGAGYHVLVVEKEMKFRDRVRGEMMQPWGSREAKRLGIYDQLTSTCALEAPYWSYIVGGEFQRLRDLKATTPGGDCVLTVPHPALQEKLLSTAAATGAHVIRGAHVERVVPGRKPTTTITQDGVVRRIDAKLVVIAEGRESKLRTALGFKVKVDPEFILIGGMLLHCENEMSRRVDAPDDRDNRVVHSLYDPASQHFIIALTVAQHLNRVYLVHHKDSLDRRLSGERDLSEAIRHLKMAGAPNQWFEGAKLAGPFATFDGAARWVDRPYLDGIALLGDAAGATDPTWGEGLARTLRDVRILRDHLLAQDDWDMAARAYAEDHDAFFHRMLRLGAMRGELMFARGPDAEARRKRAFAAHEADPTLPPDVLGLGPDAPCDDRTRARYFAEA